ncbi:hypothetical protein WJT74_02850 [Sphingomicrobium sp. XHP0239]|uniref:hypothetical protein n=1 Tax=Sphingomicrobium maritimum TaxID=3133972 RepID=UPI0031CCCB1A
MRIIFALPLLALAACGGDTAEETVPTEGQPEATELETPAPRDITAIDAATDYDGGLADEDVPGIDSTSEESEESAE